MAVSERTIVTRLSEVRRLLIERDFHPSRLLGQNFLVDGNILGILISTSQVKPGDRVLEIGPGLGAVTAGLLEAGAHVTAIEKDHRLYDLLLTLSGSDARLTLIEGDALEQSLSLIRQHSLTRLVSNLPYGPGSRILVDLLCHAPGLQTLTVTVQLEVAERLTAVPGGKDFGILGLWGQVHAEVKLVKEVSPNCFWPRPAVTSAIVHMRRRPEPALPAADLPFFYELTRYAFQHRRKQLVSLLVKSSSPFAMEEDKVRSQLDTAGVSLKARAEDLPLAVWCMLSAGRKLHE